MTAAAEDYDDALDTPVPVIDLDRVERNLARMQARCDALGVRLRPHIKTHKLPELAHRQRALGAVGITCQKLGEAEVMAAAGLDDILLSYPLIGDSKARRLAALVGRARVAVAIDNALALATVRAAARQAGGPIGVLVEFDSGMHRTGVATPDEAASLAAAVADTGELRFDGLMTYPSTPDTPSFVARTRALLAARGVAVDTVSGGGTPRAHAPGSADALTEYRAGTYVYNDRNTVLAGAATLDHCAMTVLATVVSRPAPDRAIIDAGSKTLSSDPAFDGAPGFGLLLDYPDAVIDRLSEEHGMLDLRAARARPALGERVRVLPNHCCVVSNLHDAVVLLRAGEPPRAVPVAARGRTR